MGTRRGRQSFSLDELSDTQSKYILNELLRDRRISKADLGVYVRRMQSEAEELLERLRRSLGWAGAAVASGVAAGIAIAASPRARRTVVRGAKKVSAKMAAG